MAPARALVELRDRLLKQHRELRELAAMTTAVAQRARSGQASLAELRAHLGRLLEATTAHNDFEERELRDVLPGIDAWGQVRERLMDERHAAEHEAIESVIREAMAAVDAGRVADSTLIGLAALAAHMESEESELLAADVLKDDPITSGVGG